MAEWFTSMGRRLRALFRSRQQERDLRDEIAFHLEMRTTQLRDAGAANAHADARRRFGSIGRIQDEMRDAWTVAPVLSSIAQDLRFAVRTLWRSRGFAAVVVLVLGLGIGVNTATFSVVNAVLIRPLGFDEPERLVAVHEDLNGFDLNGAASPPDIEDLQRDQRSFEGVAAYVNRSMELSGGGESMRVEAARVSATLFSLLRVAPLIGRDFTPADDRPGVDVAVVSWGLWQTRFAGDRGLVGRSITLDRRPFTVIGIMPRTFEFPRRGPAANNEPAAVWVPIAFTDRQLQSRANEFNNSLIARLKPGVSIEQAQSELDVLTTRIMAAYPRPSGLANVRFSIRLSAIPLREEIAGRIERPLVLLLGAVGLVLLVTCANVANLVLSRAASRAREIAVRAALGSSRRRLLQLVLAEAAILSGTGALLGIWLSTAIVQAVPASVADTIPAARNVSIDVRVLGFTAAIAIATSFLFALVPLVTLEHGLPASALREEGGRSTPGRRRHRMQAGLVVTTVMLAFVLLIGAGLFLRSFYALMTTDAGFRPERVLTASLMLPRAGYSNAASVRAFHQSLFSRASSMPGVRSAALVTDLPLARYERRTMSAEGVPIAGSIPPSTNLSWVYGPYFETFGIRITRGRPFSLVESMEQRWVVIVNERLARRFWPGQDPINKRIRWGLDVPQNPNRWLTVVGVIADVLDGPLGTEPFVHAYEPFSQFPDAVYNNAPTQFGRDVKLAVRTDGDPRALAAAVRSEIGRIDRELAIDSIALMEDRIDDVVAPRRFSAMTLTAFAGGALLLAAIGLYGLLAFMVAERRREIALRLALGAQPPVILRMVVGQGLKLVAVGLAIGIVVSYGAARAVASLLYETKSHDAVTFGMVPLVLVLIALAACAIPACRALRVAPITALRAE